MSKGGSREYEHGTGRSGGAGIVVKIDTKDPIELKDAGRLLISISNQYRRFCREEGVPYNQNRIVIRTVRPGSWEIIIQILEVGKDVVLGATIGLVFANQLFQFLDNLKNRRGGRKDD